jgi:KEOPS complex subunit Cgi121
LLQTIEEFKKSCEIAGFIDVEIKNVDEFLKTVKRRKLVDVQVQFFDADVIATWQHLYFAALNALMAFKNRANFCNSVAMEMLLYASGSRQIQKAMQLVGIKPTSRNIAVLIVGRSSKAVKSSLSKISTVLEKEPDDSVLELSDAKVEQIRKVFSITEAEVGTLSQRTVKEAVVDLVLERVALLSTYR